MWNLNPEKQISSEFMSIKKDFISMVLHKKTDVGRTRQRTACKLTPASKVNEYPFESIFTVSIYFEPGLGVGLESRL